MTFSSRAPTLLTAALGLAFSLFSAALAETQQQACDRLAASPFDPSRPASVEGVATGTLDIKAAIAACSAAIAAENAPRFHYQLGRAHYDSEDYSAALREFTAASDAGLPVAKAALGHLYGEGLGVARDKQKELELTRQAAEADIAFAAHNLGVILRDNAGIPPDYTASLKWFRKAVSLGYSQSLVDIGFAFDEGKGVATDYAEALHWYRLAADKGVLEAFNNLGNLYEMGNGVAQDYAVALEWYGRAKDAGYTLAYVNIAHLTDAGLGTKADPAAAAALVLKAFAEGGASDDAFNLDYVYDVTWSADFWKTIQTTLTKTGAYHGAVDGTPNAETKAAIDATLDK